MGIINQQTSLGGTTLQSLSYPSLGSAPCLARRGEGWSCQHGLQPPAPEIIPCNQRLGSPIAPLRNPTESPSLQSTNWRLTNFENQSHSSSIQQNDMSIYFSTFWCKLWGSVSDGKMKKEVHHQPKIGGDGWRWIFRSAAARETRCPTLM